VEAAKALGGSFKLVTLAPKPVREMTQLPQKKRERPRNTWRRDLESEMGTAGFNYSCRKMKAAVKYRIGWRNWSMASYCTGSSDK